MGLPELKQYKAAGNRLSSTLPQKVGKEYRDKSFEEKKIMGNKGMILGVNSRNRRAFSNTEFISKSK